MGSVNLNVNWTPYPWQTEVLKAWKSVLYLVLLCARQMGKTTLLLAILLESAGKKPTGLFWYVSPTLGLAFEQYYKFKNMLAEAPGFVFNDSKRWITLPNGARIVLVSYEQGDALRGPSVHGLVIDEVGTMTGSFIRDVLEPTTTHTGGWIVYCGTAPDPLETPDPVFFERVVSYAKTGQDPEYAYFRFDYTHVAKIEPTYKKKVERYKNLHGEDSLGFRREYLCQFVRPEEISLPFENIRWIDSLDKLPRYEDGRFLPLETITTVDPSFSDKEAADPRAIVTTGLCPDGDLYVLRPEQGRWGYQEFIARIYRAHKDAEARGWKPQWVGIEKAGVGAPFIKALQREGEVRNDSLPISEIPNFGSTLSRIMSLEPWLQQKRLVFVDLKGEQGDGWRELSDQVELFPRGLLGDTSRTKHKTGMSHHYDVLNALAFRTMNFYPPPRQKIHTERRLAPGEYTFEDELKSLKREPDLAAEMYVG